MKVVVAGATGLVGTKMLEILEERNFPVTELIPAASPRSAGKKLRFKGKYYTVVTLQDAVNAKADVALFSAGGSVSEEWAPKFAEVGCVVIDNSSAWRMDPTKPLVVPEVNANIITANDKIIANPNCSTIQLMVALSPLHKAFGIKRVVVSTYQSITGTGVKAVEQMENERAGIKGEMAYPHPIDRNCLPHCDVFTENDYTKEEMKLVNETRKILDAPEIMLSATAVRVPVTGGHSEAVNVEFNKPTNTTEVKAILAKSPGIVLYDDPSTNTYPMPLVSSEKDEVYVGRIRNDISLPGAINLWVVADNLRKGAATNAIQIAEYMVEKGLL